jgi:hypothetical protein
MEVQYFGTNAKNISAGDIKSSYSSKSYRVKPEVKDEFESMQNIKFSNGVIGYNTFKNLLMHIYQMIVNRLIRTAHLADLSTNKKSKGISFSLF